ncbi:MAG: hypothetical protein J7L63_05880 [Thermoplasmata archaeon]|nr:hypothetical protein [Thermoplasmata archaeon]
MHRIISYTLLYFIPIALILYGIWQNILALIIGLAWIVSSAVIFELTKETYEEKAKTF